MFATIVLDFAARPIHVATLRLLPLWLSRPAPHASQGKASASGSYKNQHGQRITATHSDCTYKSLLQQCPSTAAFASLVPVPAEPGQKQYGGKLHCESNG